MIISYKKIFFFFITLLIAYLIYSFNAFSFRTKITEYFNPQSTKAAFSNTKVDDHFGVAGPLTKSYLEGVGSAWTIQWKTWGSEDLSGVRTGMVHQVHMIRLGSTFDHLFTGTNTTNHAEANDTNCDQGGGGDSLQNCRETIKRYLEDNTYCILGGGSAGCSSSVRQAGINDPANSHFYVIGNEPNLGGQDGDNGNASNYRRMARRYKAVYDAIKAEDPIAKIIGPSIAFWGQYGGRDWFASFISAYQTEFGATSYPPIDILNSHPYDGNPSYPTSSTDPNHGRYAPLDYNKVECELSSDTHPTDYPSVTCSGNYSGLGTGFREWFNNYTIPNTSTKPYLNLPIWITEWFSQL